MKYKNNHISNWGVLLSCVFLLSFMVKDASGQVTYRATEDALKQLVKDIEGLRKAPASGLKDKKAHPSGLVLGSYVTKPGDTLNRIILRQLPDLPLRRNIIRMAIVKANPHAFKRKNPNWMYAGKTLRLPNADDIRSVVFREAAVEQGGFTANPDSWIKYP